MGFSGSSIFLKIAFILIIVALIIQIIAIAIPYWSSSESGNVKWNVGLFDVCTEVGGSKSCSKIDDPADWLAASQAFNILGLLVLVAALVFCIIVLFIKSDMRILKLVTWILCFVACGFILIGVIIFGAEAPDGWDEFSGGFALAIIAAIIALVGGVLVVLDWMGKGSSA